MFNFSANHLFLISRTEYCSCAVLLMLDRDGALVCAGVKTGAPPDVKTGAIAAVLNRP